MRRGGGFWKNGYWYDLNVDRRMPLVMPMLEEMLVALPPLTDQTAVCDLACGTGNAGCSVMSAYPMAHLTLIDENPDLLALARAKISEIQVDVKAIQATISADGEPLPGAPYDVILAALSLHALVGHHVDGPEADGRYELLFQGIRDSLVPGGHIIIGDHVGTLGLFRQMKALERASFVDVDCAWRQDDFFVCGGRVSF